MRRRSRGKCGHRGVMTRQARAAAGEVEISCRTNMVEVGWGGGGFPHSIHTDSRALLSKHTRANTR